MKILDRNFYQRSTVIVAQELIGKLLVRTVNSITLIGRISETEAYGFVDDSASHTYRGITPRNKAMFELQGCAYIYFSYGNHFCFNVVARACDVKAGGVLIRAIEPVAGVEHMLKNRKKADYKNLVNGPGKLTQAMEITKNLYGIDVTQPGELYIAEDNFTYTNIITTPRIGISTAQDKLWRFVANHERCW